MRKAGGHMALGKPNPEDESPVIGSNVIDAPMTPRRLTVSESLRGRRIECGLEIEHVSQILRIRKPVLVAIEEGNFDQLPGAAYAVGFVRAYATYLGLDAEGLVHRFKTETEDVSRKPHLHFPLPIRDSHVPTRSLLVICLLLTVLTYAGWRHYYASPSQMADLIPAVPERLRNLLNPQAGPVIPQPPVAPTISSGTPTSTAPISPSPTSETAPAAPPASMTAAPVPNTVATATPPGEADGVPPVEDRGSALPPPAASLSSPPDLAQPAVNGDPAKPQSQTAYGEADGASRVVLHANADSWIQVRDGQSNLVFTRVLKTGEHYNVPNQAGLTLIAGNAGGLDITVDGMEIPHIGEAGRVARNVSLDPTRLLGAGAHAN
jgi:cytoskeleton protein RodZ